MKGRVSPVKRLDAADIEILEALAVEDGAYQYNAWALKVSDSFQLGYRLRSLTRRGLVAGEGRGTWRQFWITAEGKAALEAAKAAA